MANISEIPIRFVDNSPVKFNNEEVVCNKDDREFCQLVNRADKTNFQFRLPLSHNLLINGDFKHPIAQGVANTNTTNKLVDTTALFLGVESVVGSIVNNYTSIYSQIIQVINTDSDTSATVTTIESETSLLLSSDIFPNGNENYIIHGWFDLSQNTWTIDTEMGKATCDGGADTFFSMDNIGQREASTYKITMEVTGMTAGNLGVAIGGTVFETITENGIYTIFGSTASLTSGAFTLLNHDGFNGSVNNIQVYRVDSIYTLQIRDKDDNVLATSGALTSDTDLVNYSIDWTASPFSGVANQSGLKICITGNEDGQGSIAFGAISQVLDESFSYLKNESLDNYISSGYTRANNALLAIWPSSGPSNAVQSMSIVDGSTHGWVVGRSYFVELFIHSISAGCTVQLSVGGNLGTSYTTTGHKTQTVVMGAGANLLLNTTIPSLGKIVVISMVKARYNSSVVGDPSGCSECYCLKENHDTVNLCTTLLSYYGDDNQFGFNYTDVDFIQYLRIAAHLRNPKYKNSGKTFTDSVGKMDITLANAQKMRDLAVDEVPEYIHDALNVAKMHDHILIDDVEYVFPVDDYEPEWDNDNVKYARGFLQCRKKEQNLYNRNC